MKTSKAFLTLSLFASSFGAFAQSADFIHEINGPHNRYGYGQRVIYEMNVGSMTPEGTFDAAAKRLAGLKELGVDVVWLMPVYPRGLDENSIDSPYGARDFSQVNPKYGTVEDMRRFVNAAHKLNMEVWLDWVPNHTATDNVWVETHPDFYRHNEDGTLFHPYSGPFKYNDVAQLDYENPACAEAMTATMEYWFSYTGLDGLRCDFVSSQFMPKDYWHKVMPRLKSFKSPLTGLPVTMLGESDFHSCKHLYSAGWDYDYAWEFNDRLLEVGHSADAAKLQKACEQLVNDPLYYNLDRMVYLTNHDANHNDHVHTLEQKFGDNRYAFTVLSFTLYGMPMLYNGQEIGDQQDLNYFADTKIDWSLTDPTMQNLLPTLTALKHSVPALRDGLTFEERGKVEFLATGNSAVMAYLRKPASKHRHGQPAAAQDEPQSEVLVVMNLGAAPAKVQLPGVEGEWEQWVDSKTIANGPERKAVTLDAKQKMQLPAKGYAVYVRK